MSDDRESKLKLYSLGIVIEDKKRGSDQIKIYPVEELPYIDGKVSEFKKDFKVSGPDAKGTERASNLQGDAYIIADWIPDGDSNRMTSPDVIKNETVKIYRYADTNKYYWTTLFREPSIRRLETVCWMFGNLPKGLTPFDKTSSYWLEVSTHDQKIQFHTSKSNGEPYTYDVIFDTSNGNFTIQDDAGNSILLDSPSSTIGAFNASGSFIKMVGPDISMNAPGSFTINGQRYTLTSEQNTVNGTTDVNGVSNLNQGINVKGDNGSGKTGTFEGSLNMTGRMEADQGFETPSDIHAGGAIRSDTSVSSPSTH